ncbi:hypothetical protein V5O39_18795 [Pseudomonas parakoreensis]
MPGLMLIEAARQAMYAQFYEHSGYARGEVSISIVDLLSSFPVTPSLRFRWMCWSATTKAWRSHGRARSTSVRASFSAANWWPTFACMAK